MRRRIVGLTVLTSILVAVLLGVPLAIGAAHYFVSDQRRELERSAAASAVLVSREGSPLINPPSAAPGASTVGVYGVDGRRISGLGPTRSPELVRKALHGSVTSGDIGSRYAAAAPVTDGDTVVGATLVVATPTEVRTRTLQACAVIVGVALTAVVVAWLIAARLARRIARPVEQMAATADKLGDGDFHVRAEDVGIPELDIANRALERTARRLGELVARERSLASDASHQLRTPLTGLQLGIEAALADPTADLRAALERALGSARAMDTTVTDLLALARGHRAGNQELDVAALIGDLGRRWTGLLADAGRPLRFDLSHALPPSPMPAAAVVQVLDVLIDNALRHGDGGVLVTAREASGVLAFDVEDEGSTADTNQALFDGPGIGLPLARRLAEAQGGRLVLSARAPTRFTVVSPPTDLIS